MERKHNRRLTSSAKELRKNMTKQEKHLWYDYLSTYPIRILRQKVVANFIVDFYCYKVKLIIELDGSQHYTEDGLANDEERTKILNTYGLTIIRFSNIDIDKNFEGVCKIINDEIKKRIFLSSKTEIPLTSKTDIPLLSKTEIPLSSNADIPL